jgi:hypothetical protein
MARNRVIYQSEALFVSDGTLVPTAAHTGAGKINQLHRVQSANYGFTVNRQDVNQFGQLARIDQISIEAPTVNLDFSYYLTTGNNEANLGFIVGTSSTGVLSFISGLIDSSVDANNISIVSGRNFHVLTVAEGNDANGSATGVYTNFTNARTISIGNAYITNYTVEAAVGGLPTVSVTAEGLNVTVGTGSSGIIVPGINVENGAASSNTFALPQPVTGNVGISALRPGDITVIASDGVVADLPTGVGGTNTAAHIQNLSIEVPIGRTTLERLGSRFGFTKVIDFPVEITCNMSAIVADLKTSGSIASLLDADTTKKLAFVFKLPGTAGNEARIIYELRGAKLVSENFSSTIGDNKSVDLTFTAQIGGPQDTTNGLFVWVQSNAYIPSDIA